GALLGRRRDDDRHAGQAGGRHYASGEHRNRPIRVVADLQTDGDRVVPADARLEATRRHDGLSLRGRRLRAAGKPVVGTDGQRTDDEGDQYRAAPAHARAPGPPATASAPTPLSDRYLIGVVLVGPAVHGRRLAWPRRDLYPTPARLCSTSPNVSRRKSSRIG